MRWTAGLVLAACGAGSRPVPAVAVPPATRATQEVVSSPLPEPDASYTVRYVRAPSPLVEIAVTTRSAELGPTTFELGPAFADVRDPETSIRDVAARDDRGAELAVAHPTPHTWRVTAAPGRRVTLRYAVFSSHPPGFADRFRAIVTEHLVHFGRKGARITSDRVLAMIEGLTSTAFAARLRATVIDGAPLAIDPGLLAPCLTGKPVTTWAYALGFDGPASRAANKIIGLQPGSAAARAGVREGESLGGYSITQGNVDLPVELQLGPTRRKLSYLPRGTQVVIPQFTVRDAAACADLLGPPLP